MPNIQEQRVDENGLYVRASDGREITITRPEILDRFNLELGTRAVRRLAARVFIKNRIVGVLGEEQIPLAFMDMDFNENDGTPTTLEFRAPEAVSLVGNVHTYAPYSLTDVVADTAPLPPQLDAPPVGTTTPTIAGIFSNSPATNIYASTGQVLTFYKSAVLNYFNTQTDPNGELEFRRIAVRQWMRNQIDAFFPPEVAAAVRDVDFEHTTGTPVIRADVRPAGV